MFVILPSWGMSGAAANHEVRGQNLGAKKPERAERAVYLTGTWNAIYLGALSVALIFAPHFIVSFFSADPVVSG